MINISFNQPNLTHFNYNIIDYLLFYNSTIIFDYYLMKEAIISSNFT